MRLLIAAIVAGLSASHAWAVEQEAVNQALQWIQQQSNANTPSQLQQTFEAHKGSFCGPGAQGCDPLDQTRDLQGLRQDPNGLMQRGIEAYNSPDLQPIRDFQRAPALSSRDQVSVTADQIIRSQTDIADGSSGTSCALRTPILTHTCLSGYQDEVSENRVETLVLENIVPPITTAERMTTSWSCPSGGRRISSFLAYCYYDFQVVRYTGSGLVIAGIAGTYTALLSTPVAPIQITVPEGQPFSMVIHPASTGDYASLLPLMASGSFANGAGSVTFNSGRDVITLPIIYGNAQANERWTGQSAELDESCQAVGTICTEGPSTKMFAATSPADGNSYPFKRDCWAREVTYSCRGQQFTECGRYETDPSCQRVAKTCVEQDGQDCRRYEETWACGGECQTFQRTNLSLYEATILGQSHSGEPVGIALSKIGAMQELYRNLEKEGTCDCRTKETAYRNTQAALAQNPNDSALQEAALQAQREYEMCLADDCADAAVDAAGTVTVFRGTAFACKRNLVGCNECDCKGTCSSFGMCDRTDKQSFISRKDKGLCHHVGDIKQRKLFGLPEVTAKYCCFNSKLARLIHEQGRPQLNWSWGTPEAPDCGAFSLDQTNPHYFGNLDFSRMDLSEYVHDLQLTLPDQQQLQQRVQQGVQNMTR